MIEGTKSIALLPGKGYFIDLLRPWKLVTFGIGMAWLIYGALVYEICDWDLGISFIMGSLTYMFAPWTVTTIYYSFRQRRPAWYLRLVIGLIPAMFVVDWAYWLYHSAVGNKMLRWENFKVSMALYFTCGLLWCYRGSMKDFRRELRGNNR
jgi:hypothetical protein